MSLTVSTETRAAVNALWGGATGVDSGALIDLTNPRNDDATSVDWTIVGYAMENLIALLSESGGSFTQDSGIVRRNWYLCLWEYQQNADESAKLDALLAKHRGDSGVTATATDGATQDADEDADRPWIFSEENIDSIQARGKRTGNRNNYGDM